MPDVPGPVLAESLRISHGALNTIVSRARRKGDPRAVERACGPIPGSFHRRVTNASRIRTLDARGLTIRAIAVAVGCCEAQVRSELTRVRKRAACCPSHGATVR